MSPGSSLQNRLNVQLAGALDAPRTIVFSHGFGTDQTAWTRLLPGLARDFRLVLFDHAGAGGSTQGGWNPTRYARLEAFADDLVELADELGLNGATLVGHSAGGMIGLLAATKAQARFARLVLIGASACYRNEEGYEGGLNREDFVNLYRLMMDDYRTWISQFVPHVTGKAEGDALHSYLANMLGRLPARDALAMSSAVLESDYRDWLPLVAQPTLILQARQDAVVPRAAAEYLRANIAQSELVILNADGHFPFMDVPDEVIAAIRRFC